MHIIVFKVLMASGKTICILNSIPVDVPVSYHRIKKTNFINESKKHTIGFGKLQFIRNSVFSQLCILED